MTEFRRIMKWSPTSLKSSVEDETRVSRYLSYWDSSPDVTNIQPILQIHFDKQHAVQSSYPRSISATNGMSVIPYLFHVNSHHSEEMYQQYYDHLLNKLHEYLNNPIISHINEEINGDLRGISTH